jgi:hypothetical protein
LIRPLSGRSRITAFLALIAEYLALSGILEMIVDYLALSGISLHGITATRATITANIEPVR